MGRVAGLEWGGIGRFKRRGGVRVRISGGGGGEGERGVLLREGTVEMTGERERGLITTRRRMVRSCLRRRPSEEEGEGVEELPLPLAKRPRRRRD